MHLSSSVHPIHRNCGALVSSAALLDDVCTLHGCPYALDPVFVGAGCRSSWWGTAWAATWQPRTR